ncbi:MAG: Brp/Blh family beta-carotene 15,15'-dioxygenase, partial [Acidobacteriota bacterium]
MTALAFAPGRAPAVTDNDAPNHWWRRHARMLSLASLLVALGIAVLGAPSAAVQLAGLAVGVAVFGVPHGALDHLLGRQLLRRHLGGFWIPAFFGGYLALAALVLAAWWRFPVVALVLFLAISAIHFGLGDVRRHLSTATLYPLEVAARGALPIVAPMLAHPAEVGVLFGALTGGPGPSEAALWRYAAVLAAMLAPALSWTLLHHGGRLSGGAPRAHAEVILEVLVLIAVFVLTPPLVAFLIYFCGWHSARHTLETSEALLPGPLGRAVLRFAKLAAPLSLATFALAALGWTLLTDRGLDADPALLQVVFIGLAALTVPHMVLCAAAQNSRDDDAT